MNANAHKGRCSCGKTEFEVLLSQPLSQYGPRACDCDFCQQHQAVYLSDPKGSFNVTAGEELVLREQHPGGKARFLFCDECNSLIGVSYREGDAVYGAANSRWLDERSQMGELVVVSPRKLPLEERVTRWKALWFPVVGGSGF